MKPDLFIDTIKFICELASIDLIKAVVETGYMDDFYSQNQYDSLQSGIDSVCQELKDQIFGELLELEARQWMMHALTPQYDWLFSFPSIRDKVHSKANVELLHVNELEA